MGQVSGEAIGRRERKRRETIKRIADTGLRLFVDNGYDTTTLDAIAVAAGISRRSFFSYFESKEDVLLAHDGGDILGELEPLIQDQPADQAPLDVARISLRQLASRYETRESIVADRLLRSTRTLRLRKEARLIELEERLAEALHRRWPAPALRPALRMDAMIATGALRLALAAWREGDGAAPLADLLDESFELLQDRVAAQPDRQVATAA